MKTVKKVNCLNNGGFVQEFRIKWRINDKEGATPWSVKYPNPQSRSFDLGAEGIPEGAEVWPEVHAILGKTKQAWEHAIFSGKSEDAAFYRTAGTIWSFSVKLEN